jgi:transposase, IS6 family
MSDLALFNWRHFAAKVILCSVRWRLRYALSYCDVAGLMQERGLAVDHTTILRWVQQYAPELDKRCPPRPKATNDSYRIDETTARLRSAGITSTTPSILRVPPWTSC